MNKFNQLIKGIIQKRNNYAKEKERNQRRFEKAIKYMNIKHDRGQAKLFDRTIKVAENEFTKKGEHPLLCSHDHCLWWRKEHTFKDFKSKLKSKVKKITNHLTAEHLEQVEEFIKSLKE